MPPILTALLPLLRALGINPEKYVNDFARDTVRERMRRAVPDITTDLTKRGLTPARFDEEPVKRQFIRSAMFQALKAALPFRNGAGHVADFIRDQHDDQVLARVDDRLTPDVQAGAAVGWIVDELVERMF